MAQDGTSRGRFVATLALVTLVTAFVGSLVSLRLGGHTTDPADNAPPTFRRIRLFNGTGKDFQAGKTKVFGSSGIRVGFAGTGFLPRMQPTAQRLEGKRGPCVAGDRGRLDVGSGACVTETSMPAS